MKIFYPPIFLLFTIAGFSQPSDSLTITNKIDSLIQVSRALTGQWNFEKALEINAVAEKLAIEKMGENSAAYGSTCFNHGRVLANWGHYSEAEEWYLRSMAIKENVIGRESYDFTKSLNNLGILYRKTGHYEKAEPLFLEAIKTRGKIKGENSLEYGSVLNGLAILYTEMGKYEKAEKLFLESISIKEKLMGKANYRYVGSLINLSLFYEKIGINEKALQLLLEAKDILENDLSAGNNMDYANCLASMATVKVNLGDSEEAEPLFIEAMSIYEKNGGSEKLEYINMMNSLGVMYLKMKNFTKAEEFLLESKNKHKALFEKENSIFSLNLGDLYWNMGRDEEAETQYSESLKVDENFFGKDHPEIVECLFNLGLLYAGRNQPDKAETYFSRANKIEQTKLLNASQYLSQEELLEQINGLALKQNWVLSFTHNYNRLINTAFDNTLFYKGYLLNTVMQIGRLAQHADAYDDLKFYRRRLGIEYAKPYSQQKNVAELEANAEQLEKELVRSVAGLEEAIKQISFKEVQSSLKEGEAAIEFVHYKYSNPRATDSIMYAALVLKPGNAFPDFVPLFEEQELLAILEQKESTRKNYFDRIYRGLVPQTKKVNTKAIYELVWQPLDSFLNGVQRIYFSPSGLLYRMNHSALPKSKKEILGDQFELVQLGSTRNIVVPKEATFNNDNAVVFGGINYNAGLKSKSSATSGEDIAFQPVATFNNITRNWRGGEWQDLKGTALEADEVAQLLTTSGFQTEVQKGETATEGYFKSIGSSNQWGKSPRVLHIATHGFFFPDPSGANKGHSSVGVPVFKISDDPMIRSGLLLAGANPAWKGEETPPGQEDGILTAYEISQMDLSNTELVVLSACETGLGDIQGNEGVYGLQRAFKIAGVKYLIMSLWDVSDEETADFMITFYKVWLGGKDIHSAFRETQRAMREDYPDDPYLWAGFVFVE